MERSPEWRESFLIRGVVAVLGGTGQDRAGYRVGGGNVGSGDVAAGNGGATRCPRQGLFAGCLPVKAVDASKATHAWNNHAHLAASVLDLTSNKPRRVVAKVEWHAGEMFPRVGFIVTNLRRAPRDVVRFCNQRGTAEQWIKEGKSAVKWTRLSCHDFADNQVRLQLFALACNVGNFLRRLALPTGVKHWSLTTPWEKLIKIGAKVVSTARYVVFQMAEVAVPPGLFRAILERIHPLQLPEAVPR